MRGHRGVQAARVGVGTIAVLAALLVGCGSDPDLAASTTDAPAKSAAPAARLPEAVQELTIDATEYRFAIDPDVAGGVEPGWTRITFHNRGVEAHQVMFARIKDGVDLADLAAAGAGDSSGAGAIKYVDMIGGVSYIGAGHDTTALVHLTPGLVMAMCYVPDTHGVAHALMGMSTPLTVSEPAGGGTGAEATPSGTELAGTITLAPDGYRLPAKLRSGWYHVTNTDDAVHELSLMRLGESIDDAHAGAVVADLAANKTPDVTVEAVGGLGAVSGGFDGYLRLDLTDGDYLAVDFMPDPDEPRPHMLDGYWATFSV